MLDQSLMSIRLMGAASVWECERSPNHSPGLSSSPSLREGRRSRGGFTKCRFSRVQIFCTVPSPETRKLVFDPLSGRVSLTRGKKRVSMLDQSLMSRRSMGVMRRPSKTAFPLGATLAWEAGREYSFSVQP